MGLAKPQTDFKSVNQSISTIMLQRGPHLTTINAPFATFMTTLRVPCIAYVWDNVPERCQSLLDSYPKTG